MKKILIIVLIILFLVLPLFAEEAKKPIIKYKVPEVTLLISDGVAFI
jgi:predicted S18 family serine protease